MIKHNGVRVASTIGMSREEWLEIRRSGIGGSDIGAICGINPWSSPVDVWLSKVEGKSTEENERMYWGKALEEVVAIEFAKRNPSIRVERCNAVLRHTDQQIAFANLDRLVEEDGKSGVLEIKTASGFGTAKWDDGVPLMYQAQVQWYLWVTGLNFAYVAVLLDGCKYEQFRIERDRESIQTLVATAQDFWDDYVVTKSMPAPVVAGDLEPVRAAFRPVNGAQPLQITEEFAILLDTYNRAKEREKALGEDVEILQAKIIAALANHEEAEGYNFKVTFRANKDSVALDVKTLEKEEPETYQSLFSRFPKTTRGARPLRIKKVEV
jgi:putative phage-type endonuclease